MRKHVGKQLKNAVRKDLRTLAEQVIPGLTPRFDFKNKKVFITGGSRGLGLSLAWNLIENGAAVTLAARSLDELDRGRNLLLKDFPKCRVFIKACDVTDPVSFKACLEQSITEMGGLDLLVNNAGSILVGPFESMEMEDFEAQMKLHLFAVIRATKLILPYFKSQGAGRILNICSLGGKVAVPHMLPYDVSKFALAGFSQGVGPELAREGITLTTAYPTVMRTGSTIQAVFKGNHEKEFEWFHALDHMPGLSMSADEAAKKILRAVADGKSEIVLSLPAKIRMAVGAFFPELTNKIMTTAALALPTENSMERKTGADSQERFNQNVFFTPLRRIASRVQALYNQEPKHDAEYNMGIRSHAKRDMNMETPSYV